MMSTLDQMRDIQTELPEIEMCPSLGRTLGLSPPRPVLKIGLRASETRKGPRLDFKSREPYHNPAGGRGVKAVGPYGHMGSGKTLSTSFVPSPPATP